MTNQRNDRQTSNVHAVESPVSRASVTLGTAAWCFGLPLREAKAPTQPTQLTLSVSST
jgi:hypothetical protein